MPNDVQTAMSESQHYFYELVKKPLGEILGCNKFELIEGVDNNIARQLDIKAGIDAWLDHPNGLIGLALRIQYDDFYRTFTIRYQRESGAQTEYEKRLLSFQHGGLAPMLTVQAYVDRKANRLIGGAVARTKDILTCIEQNKYQLHVTGNNQVGRASFYSINWSDVAELESAKPHSWCPVFGINDQ